MLTAIGRIWQAFLAARHSVSSETRVAEAMALVRTPQERCGICNARLTARNPVAEEASITEASTLGAAGGGSRVRRTSLAA